MRLHHRLPSAAIATRVTSAANRWDKTALLAFLASVLLAPSMANATPICVWLDDAGRTQYASVVPEPYKSVATCTDSQKYELSPEQQRATEQAKTVREDRARARLEAAKPAASSASGPPRVADTAPRTVTKRPAEVVTESTDCTTWWRLYDESAECFGPFRTTGGAIKVEAFGVCNVVPSPEPRCGLRRN
jgi:hypothetical protein